MDKIEVTTWLATDEATFAWRFRSLFGEFATLKFLSGESPVFDAISKQNNIVFLSLHDNGTEPSYLEGLVEALMKSDENNKVTLLFELYPDFDLNEMIKLINEDPSLIKKYSPFSENLINLIKTLGKLKEQYGERFEIMLIDIPAVEKLKFTKNLLKLAGKLPDIELDSELTKRINVSEEEFERMSTKQKIEIINACNDIKKTIEDKSINLLLFSFSRDINDKDIEDILCISQSFHLNRNIKIVENVEKIYNEYKDKDGYNIIFYGGLAHGFEILKKLKEVKIPQRVTAYLPIANITAAHKSLNSSTSKEKLAEINALVNARRG